jgi:glycosyltransferase involved in cell wall biosynthesis
MEGNRSFCNDFRTIALIGNYLPRKCGIATFTADLLEALSTETPGIDYWAVAMNDVPEGYRYPRRVRFELNQQSLTDYRLAADFLNMNHVDAICLQHEFGIFGGDDGGHILELLANLRMPLVTTLHTVLMDPTPGQKAVLGRIAQISDKLVVMSHKAKDTLRDVCDVPAEKVALIHHGIPDVPFVDPNYYKDQFGVEGRRVILTFGLISPGKGIEYMIDALPAVVKKYPETTYIVLGATHPHEQKEQGEAYRLSLQRLARDLNVADHVIFHNRFVDLKELCEFIGAADLYVTPYLNREQIVSGTLAYALGAGKAVISTPYRYAEEMLDEGRGRIVQFRDSAALSEQVLSLFENEVERHAMRKRAYTFCRSMIWTESARAYLNVFSEIKEEREKHPRVVFQAKTLQENTLELPKLRLDHLRRMTDDVGLLQHAKFIVPDRVHGYCTDDNARALIVALMAQGVASDGVADLVDLASLYLGFLQHAFNDEAGRFRNFMSYDRSWVEEAGTEDCHGRAIWGLGMTVALSKLDNLTEVALNLFERALPVMSDFQSPRAWAFGLVGIHAYLRRFSGDSEVRRVRAILAARLFELYKVNANDDWPWIEDKLAYANGKISQSLLLSGQWLQQGDMVEAGFRSLEWLVQIQNDPKGHFVPIGNDGWWARNGHRARFDQQPIEAHNMIEACIEAYKISSDEKWIAAAQRCLEWFLGRNDLNASLYDYKTGGCCDGLTPDGTNRNQGAESTLAWLLSLLNMYSVKEAKTAVARETLN